MTVDSVHRGDESKWTWSQAAPLLQSTSTSFNNVSPAFASLLKKKAKKSFQTGPGLTVTKVNLLVFRCKGASWRLMDLSAAPGRTERSGEKNRVAESGTFSSLPLTTSRQSRRRRLRWPSKKLLLPRKTASVCVVRAKEMQHFVVS